MEKALEILKADLSGELYYVALHGICETSRAKILREAIAMIEEAMKPKTCEWCKWEQETKLITTKVGDKVDICKLCTRYENLQDHYELKANA